MFVVTIKDDLLQAAAASEAEIESLIREEIGNRAVKGVQDLLGTEEVYQLTPGYSARKVAGLTKPPMVPMGGKATDQPLILTGSMYGGVQAQDGDGTVDISVDDAAGISEDGFDYAEYWQSGEGSKAGFAGVDYLGQGVDRGLEGIDEVIADLIMEALDL